jgi:hypothetical protein
VAVQVVSARSAPLKHDNKQVPRIPSAHWDGRSESSASSSGKSAPGSSSGSFEHEWLRGSGGPGRRSDQWASLRPRGKALQRRSRPAGGASCHTHNPSQRRRVPEIMPRRIPRFYPCCASSHANRTTKGSSAHSIAPRLMQILSFPFSQGWGK